MSAEKPHAPNSGLMYPNHHATVAQGGPDYGGEATFRCHSTGKEYRLRVSQWKKIGQGSGRELRSLSFRCLCPDCQEEFKKRQAAKGHAVVAQQIRNARGDK
jgi:hypothetical protein